MKTTIREATATESEMLAARAADHYRCAPDDVRIGSVCTDAGMLYGQVFCARRGFYLGLESIPANADFRFADAPLDNYAKRHDPAPGYCA